MNHYQRIIDIKMAIARLIPFGEFELFYRLIIHSFDGDKSEARAISLDGPYPEEEFLIELMDTLQR